MNAARRQFLKTSLAALTLALAALFAAPAVGQETVTIEVSADAKLGPWNPVWRFFGYDEPNYTYAPHGRQLLGELSALSRQPAYARTHNLLTSGNGVAALKWGSTNAYTEDASGRPVYDWRIMDRIFDAYRDEGVTPFVEIGFMPKALSTHPDPYQHTWPNGPLDTGWSYPPNDYAKWGELVNQWVRHAVARYGRQQVESWYWEVWNEPDIFYWHGTPEEYFKLYDYAADGVKRALPTARIGGPATTGPSANRAGQYLRQFLEHCTSGKNFASGATGCPLDFITFHAKGRVSVVDQHVRMDIARQIADVRTGLEIVSAFPNFRRLPIFVSESDPEGCAACSARLHPENAYRNTPLYAAYNAAMLNNILELDEHREIEGVLTWAFEFEDHLYFEGYRTLATNGVDKPVLNFFRMAGLMHGDRVRVRSSAHTVPGPGAKAPNRDRSAIAVRNARELSVLAWNYDDDDAAGPAADVVIDIDALPADAQRILVTEYRIDQEHSNAYAAWQRLGQPQQPTAEQQAALVAAGQLQTIGSPRWITSSGGKTRLRLALPRETVARLQLSWGRVCSVWLNPDRVAQPPSAVRVRRKPLHRQRFPGFGPAKRPLYAREVPKPLAPGRSPTQGLLLGLVITLAAVVVCSWYINRQIAGLRELQRDLTDRNRKDSLQLLRIQNDLNSAALAMRDMLDADEPYPLTAWSSQFQRIRADLDDALRLEEQLALSRRTPEQRAYLAASLQQFWDAMDRMFAVARQGKDADARAQIRVSLQARQAALSGAVARLLVENNEAEQQTSQRVEQIYSGVQRQVYIFLAATLVTILFTSVYLIVANRRIFAELASLSRQRSELAQRLISMQESTLRHVSRELHDEFGQILTAIGAMLARAGRQVPEGSALRGDIREVAEVAQSALQKVRSLSQALHPVTLEEAGLESTLDWYIPTVERQTGLAISYEKSGSPFPVKPAAGVHVYRVLQEALNNVTRHSGADRASVRLRFCPGEIELEIEDRGKGASQAGSRQGLGVVAMRERAELLGGKFEILQPDSGGTLVRLVVPRGAVESDER